jgi:calcineurin-like phosphoesterase family protein
MNKKRTWFTSDTHFSHRNILEYCPLRNYRSVDEMNESILKMWNSTVRPYDDVYHLGDVIFGKDYEILERLNGNKHLIIGNHDQFHISKSKNSNDFCKNFISFHEYNEVVIDGVEIVMMHYPIESWNGMRGGVVHLHGHSHNTLKTRIKNRFDVGIDAFPNMISLDQIKKLSVVK